MKTPVALLSTAILFTPSVHAAVVVYHSYATVRVTSDSAIFTDLGSAPHLEVSLTSSQGRPGLVRALSTFGPGVLSLPGPAAFQTAAQTAAEGWLTRTAEADSYWDFTVTDADTTFELKSLVEFGAAEWTLHDLTTGLLVDGDSYSGFQSPIVSGNLIAGHNYRIAQNVQTLGTSDELAQLSFRVGTDVVFQIVEPVPETSGWMTSGVFLLAVGGMGAWRKRQIRGRQR